MPASEPEALLLAVPQSARGLRLDRYLASLAASADAPGALAQLSRARLQQLVRSGAIGSASTASSPSGGLAVAQRLRGGEQLHCRLPAPTASPLTPQAMPLQIVHEDADLLVVNKAAGLVVHAGAGVQGPTLVQGLLAHCVDLSGIGGVLRPGIVHRLDRATSGLLVVAKHDRAHVGLARQFAARQVTKTYVAVVLGTPAAASAELDTAYGRHPRLRQRFTSRADLLARLPGGGRPLRRARTAYRLLATQGGCSLLRVALGTGRTHQIRVHLSDLGHPVLGDCLYGGLAYGRIASAELRQLAAALPYQALHAAKLQLRHPCTGAVLRLQAELPAPLARLAQHLCAAAPLHASVAGTT